MSENNHLVTTLTEENQKIEENVPAYSSNSEIDDTKPAFKITWEDVNIKVKKTNKQILENFSGCFEAGKLIGILGASGSGKTTLLNYISGYTRNDLSADGKLYFNSEKVPNLKKLKRISSYVLQQDILIGVLTVEETLYYQVRLKLDKSSDYKKIVDNAIDLMDLGKCRHSRVGDIMNRGISGGQRKRLSIACELVTEPSLLILDEPTTGLDSDNAENVVKCMKQLSKEGKLVVSSLHQPGKEVLQLFDVIIIMHKGKRVYDGPYHNLRKFFSKNGIHIPENCYAIEFLMNLINMDKDNLVSLNENLGGKLSGIYTLELINKMEKLIKDQNSNQKIEMINDSQIQNDDNSSKDQIMTQRKRNISVINRESGLFCNQENGIDYVVAQNCHREENLFSSVLILQSRYLKCLVRTKSTWWGMIIGWLIVLILNLVIWRDLSMTGQKAIQNRLGNCYDTMASTIFTTVNLLILSFYDYHEMNIKEIEQGLYTPLSSFLAKTTYRVPLNLL